MLKIKKDEWKKLAALSNSIDRKLRYKYTAPKTDLSPAVNDYIAGAVVPSQVKAIVGENEPQYPEIVMTEHA